jgi:DNA adenine methylase
LKVLVNGFTPTVAAFDQFQTFLTGPLPDFTDPQVVVSYGFAKLAIHQISYSGLGLKSGGPLGGRDQKSEYPIDCRWSPAYICRGIDEAYERLADKTRQDRCSNEDFTALLLDADRSVMTYLDPPYYDKGGELYHCSFDDGDHVRLRDALRETGSLWLLSYDDHPRVRELYGDWADIEVTESISYSITAKKGAEKKESREKPELLITRRLP